MKKCHLLLLFLLLLHVWAMAQNKDPDECCHDHKYEYEWRKLGGHLKVFYDGERFSFHLQARFPDTNSLARTFIKARNEGQWFSIDMGKIKIGGREERISLSSNDISYEVNDHIMLFNVIADDVPYVVNGSQDFQILMTDFSPDSTVIKCTGKETIVKAEPQPQSFNTKQVNFISADTNRLMRHTEYVFSVTGSEKGAFSFSRLTLRKNNLFTSLFGDEIITNLLILVSFWYVWYLFVACRAQFEKIDRIQIPCVIKWLPWITPFFFIFILDEIVRAEGFIRLREIMKTFSTKESDSLTWRIGLCTAAVLLILFQWLWRKGVVKPLTLLCKALCRTVGCSMLAFVLIGVVLQVIDYLMGNKNTFARIDTYLKLEVSARYAVWVIVAVYMYLLFVLYKLFAFDRGLRVIFICFTLFMVLVESYPILDAGEKAVGESCVRYEFVVKKLGETKGGILNLTHCFKEHVNLVAIIPFVLAMFLIIQLGRRKGLQNVMVLMASLFFVLYSGLLTNMRENFLFVPVTLMAAIILNRFILVRNKRTRLQLIQTGERLYKQEMNDIQVFKKMPELRKSVKLKESYRQQLLDGKLMPADFERAIADIDKLVEGPEMEHIPRRMEFGPNKDYYRNGEVAFVYGLLVSGIFYAIYFKFYLIETHSEVKDTIGMISQHLRPVVMHGVAAFCLGYFFPFLRGNSGWEKGAWLGAAMGLANLPIVYFTVENAGWAPLGGIFFKHVIILMITGFLACDLVTIRKIFGRNHAWKEVIHVMGWKKTITLGAFVMTAVGSGITSWISENVLDALKSFLNN